MKLTKILFICVLALLTLLVKPVWAFCGFYVAKADAKLYNQASQVVIARDGERTILTMANDYQGEVKDFALVVPVPVVVEKEQVKIGDRLLIERLDAFSAPRLVEYFDENPCQPPRRSLEDAVPAPASPVQRSRNESKDAKQLGVTIEKQFSVGEYDILVLSAKESNGLQIWLNQNGYKVPKAATEILQPYVRSQMKFFVAKVNLKEFANTGFQSLRPLMMAYESPRFMLPIRLGMVNAKGDQDLIVYILSPKGRVEVANYRTVKIPSDSDVPEFVKEKFSDFYKAMFATAYTREEKKVAFLEYTWDMGSCDPCSAEPLTPEELKQAGVFWLDSNPSNNVFISRIHVRYNRSNFPEDLRFQQTANQETFQGRYVIRHPFQGNLDCPAGSEYQQTVRTRQEKEAQNLASLTGWDLEKIRSQINFTKVEPKPWWQQVFP